MDGQFALSKTQNGVITMRAELTDGTFVVAQTAISAFGRQRLEDH